MGFSKCSLTPALAVSVEAGAGLVSGAAWLLPHEWVIEAEYLFALTPPPQEQHVSGRSAFCGFLGLEQTSCVSVPQALPCKQSHLLSSGTGPFLESPHCHGGF